VVELPRFPLTAVMTSAVAPVTRWSRRLSHSLGAGGAFDNVARGVEEQRVAREQVELLARRLAAA
jgi:hypothetical protein